MPLPRPAVLRGAIRSFSAKRVGTQARTGLRGVGRRTYASEHGAQKSSDLPWMIGAVVVTVPAAGWLLQQGPTKSDHGHSHEPHVVEEPADDSTEESKDGADDEEAPKEDESENDDSGKKDDGDDEDSKDDAKQEDSKDDGDKDDSKDGGDEGKDDSGQQGEGKGQEVSRKGTAVPDPKGGEKAEDKQAQGDISGANNPLMGSPSKQHKPEGPAATAKIHGTVDTSKRDSPEPPPAKDTDEKKQPRL